MVGINVTDPRLQRMRRRRIQQAPSEKGIPDTTDIEVSEALRRAGRGLRERASTAQQSLGERRLAERIRATGEEESLRGEIFDISEEQAGKAEAIDLASLGLEGLSGLNLIQEANRQVGLINEMIVDARERGDILAEHRAKELAILKGVDVGGLV
jgi:hypothetical protein